MSRRNKKPEVSYNDFERSFVKWADNFIKEYNEKILEYNKNIEETNASLPYPLWKKTFSLKSSYDYYRFYTGGHATREEIMEEFIKFAFKLDRKSINSLPKHAKNRVLMMLI
jgi:hypothetical protein